MPSVSLPSQNFEPKSGERFAGRFALKNPIGEWGATPVWIAGDRESGKDCALAFLPKLRKLDADGLNRLRREVRRARQVIHPHIVRVHELIEAEDGLALLLDAAAGTTVAKLQADQPSKAFSIADIKPWAGYLCQSLEDAHRAGLLHLDLCPDHLLVRPDGTLAILHFGIGKVIRDLSGPEASTARVPYTSPQILNGEPPDASDDVYAVGTLLFEMLTGAPPFSGGTAIADIRKTVPPTVGARRQALGIGTVPVPKHWDRVVASCLAKERAERPATAGQITTKLGVETPGIAIAPIDEPAAEAGTAPAATPSAPAKPGKQAEPKQATRPAEKPSAERKPETKPPPKDERERVPERLATTEPAQPAQKPAQEPGAAPEKKRGPEPDQPAREKRDLDEKAEPEWKPGERAAKSEKGSGFPRTAFLPDEEEVRTKKQGSPVAAAVLVLVLLMIAAVAFVVSSNKGGTSRGPSEKPNSAGPSAPHVGPSGPGTTPGAEIRVPPTGKTPGHETRIGTAKESLEKALAGFMSKEEASRRATEAQRAVTGALAHVAVESQTAADRLVEAERRHEALVRKAGTPPSADEKRAIAESEAKLKKIREAKTASEVALRALEQKSSEARKIAEQAAAEWAAAQNERDAHGRRVEPAASSTPDFQVDSPPPKGSRQTPPRPSAEAKPETAPGNPSPSPTPETEPPSIPSIETTKATPSPAPTAAPADEPDKEAATKPGDGKAAFENSLGMRFAPVGRVLFSVHLTRIRDFETFANAGGIRSSSWRRPGFKQGPDHPVVNVSWEEAVAFCAWLTKQEQAEGVLPKDKQYRLPSDLEWSQAVGLPPESGSSPELRDMAVADVYPWGTAWPPPADAGNYTGEETGSEVAIRGFNDSFPWTSPVGSFRKNAFGLYDMGGNVWQWCMDWWSEEKRSRVLRGGSWYNGALKLSLLSSCRIHYSPGTITDNSGFRVVVASRPEKTRND
jgi:serine/threonine protein kinase